MSRDVFTCDDFILTNKFAKLWMHGCEHGILKVCNVHVNDYARRGGYTLLGTRGRH